MQTLNIVSALNNQNSAAKTSKSNPVVNADNSFNKLLKKEISGNKATSAPAPRETNSKLPTKNVEPPKQDAATPPEELHDASTALKKSEDTEKEDTQTEKKETDDSDHQLIQLFNALNDISKLVPAKSGDDAALKSDTGVISDTSNSGLSLQPLNEKNASQSAGISKEAAFDVIVSNTLSSRLETTAPELTAETPVTDTSQIVKDKGIGSDTSTSFADHLDLKSEKGEPLTLQTSAQQDVSPKTNVSADKLERSIDQLALSLRKDEAMSPVNVQQAPPQQQLNATQNATITGAVSANQISPPLNSSAWDKAVGQKVIWMVGASMQSAELTLNPPDLGPLQIVLNVTNDQANATFISAHPDVREALEASLPKLRQMMDDAGVQLSGFSVNAEASNQGQQGREFRQTNPSTSIARNGGGESVISNQPISDVKTTKIISRIGAVDTFA
ncbi:flagellar hook-length control protein FliK [Undibacterium sp. 14-3-2]|uniref:flagellar hook-length control protein FliK n=1 Tax=Undibacterium sp. 14-3-2 TaxID=2800129 RepID=UPI00190361DA|nr:flagellar hook-length control protein FliK [Undibacterium sp. 14-3-2]MBK1891779.1 flagellar hook-length control protein FliK [Undibacterium sp. 14-3-2]